jgi:hypothetical protein
VFRFILVSNKPSSMCCTLHEVITKRSINFLCATEKCRVSRVWVEVHFEERMARCKQCLSCRCCSEILVDVYQCIEHKFC